MAGALHRRVEIATQPGEARGVVEDDFHHFRVVIRHADGVVTEAFSDAPRHPTVICPAAGARLSELVGMRLDPSSAAALGHTDARQQCTHMIDLAGLAIAAASRQIARRTYEAIVPDRVDDRTAPSLTRDGAPVLAWEMAGDVIQSPVPYGERSIGTGFTGWARDALDLDAAEAALVLRRAAFISRGRGVDLDAMAGGRTGPMGGCWTWQPERADRAARMIGSTVDWTGRAELLTADDQDWLAFAD